jgi:hypothetical protein
MAMMQGSQGGGGGQQEEYYDEPEPQYAPPPAPAAAPVPAYVQELETLNNLKNQGVLTQEEYDAKKKQILGL